MEEELYLKIVEPRQHLWWWVREKIKLSEESIVEGVLVLAFGDMKAVKALLQAMGKKKLKQFLLNRFEEKDATTGLRQLIFLKRFCPLIFENVLSTDQLAMAEKIFPV